MPPLFDILKGMRNKKELRNQFLRNTTHDWGYSEKLRALVGNFTWGKLTIIQAAMVELAMRELAGDERAGRALAVLKEVEA